eukprot:CAMPEP_0184866590 /NCGR_PEP_ID=MMETSP0580-20130426/22830_1 /TAXON_ID=1118495 /ORGANISM="Dactyliosolen fragilissimus" /LENGTH=455 /DNA_ID=CAMNT_0027366333 /DNA_START=129 /DNA_END=1496 /DNA_ORIENTATION=-
MVASSAARLGVKQICSNSQLIQKGLPSLHSKVLNPYAPVAKWILTTSGLVAGMVHVGGVTRLTKSGLSMTDWKPLGSLPPMNKDEWTQEFNRYKTFPEWQQRKSMTLEEFKYIFYWEWGHRMLGRGVGLAFALPWGYFAFRGLIPPGYSNRMKALFAMGGTQGLVGWWMVKSGLGEDRLGDRKEIRVSPYRLAAHLGMAFSTYSLLLWTGLGIFQYPNDAIGSNNATNKLQDIAKSMTKTSLALAKKVRGGAIAVTGLTALTVVSGAFVAGNDAGNAYNTFPLMNEQWIPLDDMIDPELSSPVSIYRNMFENTAMVQWNHRVLATTTATSALTLASVAFFHPAARASLTPQVHKGLTALGGAALGQWSLGVCTLLNYVPISLAAAHQMGSLVLLSSGIYVVHSLRYVSPKVLGVVNRIISTTKSGNIHSIANPTVVASKNIGHATLKTPAVPLRP